jgi:hypothetical protein
MGRGLSNLQRQILVYAAEHENLRPADEDNRKAWCRLYLIMPDEVWKKANEVAKAAFWAARHGGINGSFIFHGGTVAMQWVMLEDEVKKMLGGEETVSQYIASELREYLLMRCSGLAQKMAFGPRGAGVNLMRANGMYVYRDYPAWLYVNADDGDMPTPEQLAEIRNGAPLGGFWYLRNGDVETSETVTYNDMLEDVCGLPMTGNSYGRAFDVKAIGESRYNSARAALQRACQRLQQRGLVGRYSDRIGGDSSFSKSLDRAGIRLTRLGRDVAADLIAAARGEMKAAA